MQNTLNIESTKQIALKNNIYYNQIITFIINEIQQAAKQGLIKRNFKMHPAPELNTYNQKLILSAIILINQYNPEIKIIETNFDQDNTIELKVEY